MSCTYVAVQFAPYGPRTSLHGLLPAQWGGEHAGYTARAVQDAWPDLTYFADLPADVQHEIFSCLEQIGSATHRTRQTETLQRRE